MFKLKRALTPEEIHNHQESENENFEDSDSECATEDEKNEISFRYNKDNTITIVNPMVGQESADLNQALFWMDAEGKHKPNIHRFKGKNDIKGRATEANTELEFFECVFPNELLFKITQETNKYARQVLQLGNEMKSPMSATKQVRKWIDTNPLEMRNFLALTLLMGHVDKGCVKEYWSTNEMLETPFFSKTMPRDRYMRILQFLHFADNSSPPDKENPNYDHMWKIRDVFTMLNDQFKMVYDPTEELSIDEVIVSFKGRVVFRQYIPKKGKQFEVKIYKLTDQNGYTFNMKAYLGKDKCTSVSNELESYTTVTEIVSCVKGKGHKLFMDNFFSSPALFVELFQHFEINSCGRIQSNKINFPEDLVLPRMKSGDTSVKFAAGMTALCWKDKSEVYMLSNMHAPLQCDLETGKPAMVCSYNKNMGCVNMSNKMANSYTFGRKTMKWTKKIFFHLLDLSVLNAYVLFKMKNDNSVHKNFRQKLILQMVKSSHVAGLCSGLLLSTSKSSMMSSGNSSFDHWPVQEKVQRRCVECKKNSISKRTSVSCKKCNVGLCVNCFEPYHSPGTKAANNAFSF